MTIRPSDRTESSAENYMSTKLWISQLGPSFVHLLCCWVKINEDWTLTQFQGNASRFYLPPLRRPVMQVHLFHFIDLGTASPPRIFKHRSILTSSRNSWRSLQSTDKTWTLKQLRHYVVQKIAKRSGTVHTSNSILSSAFIVFSVWRSYPMVWY